MPNPAVEEYGKIIEAIRIAVRSPEAADPDLLSDDAAQFSEAVAEVNERLRDAGKLLQKGLRVEAVQLCQTEPNVLELVQVLDFPERDSWGQLVNYWQWPPPPDLHLEIATSLDTAYAELQTLDPLLRKYRRLNLQRAPLAERGMVLRQLHHTDPHNHLWRDSIMEIESLRLSTIESEMDQAYGRQDGARINSIFEEMTTLQWVTPIPQVLVDKINSYRVALYQGDVRTHLETILGQWEAAGQAGNEAEGNRCRLEWNSHAQNAGMAETDPLNVRVRPLLTWMTNVDAAGQVKSQTMGFRRELNALLDRRAPTEEIEQAKAKVLRLGGEIPKDVERRISDTYQREAKGQKNRTTAIIAGAVILVLFMLGMLALLVLRDISSKQDSTSNVRPSDQQMALLVTDVLDDTEELSSASPGVY